MDDEKRRALEKLYSELSPEERRRRIILEPAFRDAYNELAEADRQFPVPTYLWEKWVPAIGVFPVAVYIELRRMCFVNRATGERRDWCWPRQETIAARLGVKKRQTVGEALRVLEANGFIRREKSYRKRGGEALMLRGSDKYLVFFEVPLVEADAVELMLRRTSPSDLDGGAQVSIEPEPLEATVAVAAAAGSDMSAERTYRSTPDMSVERTYREVPVDNSPDTSVFRTEPAGRFSDSRTVTRTNSKNVNVCDDKLLEDEPQDRKSPGNESQVGSEERARIERLAFEMGESLKAMGGNRSGGEHHSHRFHALLAARLPESLIRRALGATRDAVEAQRAGRGGLRSDPGAYFAGIARNLAADEGLEFPARRHPAKASAAPTMRPVVQASARPAPASESDEKPLPPEEAKKYIAEILANLSATKSGKG